MLNTQGDKKADKQQSNRKRVPGIPFKPGQSGNPKGRPKKGNTYAEMIRAIGNYASEKEGKTLKEAAIEAMWKKAAKGDVAALKVLTDREAGYPRQSVEIDDRPKDKVKVIE